MPIKENLFFTTVAFEIGRLSKSSNKCERFGNFSFVFNTNFYVFQRTICLNLREKKVNPNAEYDAKQLNINDMWGKTPPVNNIMPALRH